MVCEVCGWDAFVAAEYASEVGRAPALECARCSALTLDERVATTEAERESVRLAKAVRDSICHSQFPRP
jgi:hypothetical protein